MMAKKASGGQSSQRRSLAGLATAVEKRAQGERAWAEPGAMIAPGSAG